MSLFDDLLNKVQPIEPKVIDTLVLPTSSASAELIIQQDPLGVNNANNSPIISISDSTPIITNIDILEAPVALPVALPVAPPVIEATDSVFMIPVDTPTEMIPNNSNTIAFLEEWTPITPVSMEESVTIPSPFFDMSSEVAGVNESIPTESLNREDVIPEDTLTESLFAETTVDTETMADEVTKKEISFKNTAEYLIHAAEEMDVLETILVSANEAKITERDGYKEQKKHYAELEKTAEGEHKKMIEELAHVADMQEYFQKELIKDSKAANDSTFELAA
jgi:hypothetical protein